MSEDLRNYVRMVLSEGRDRGTVTISNGATVPFGSTAHVKDLDERIEKLKMWRNLAPRGSEKRANYARLINQLRNEKRAALRYAERYGEPAVSTTP